MVFLLNKVDMRNQTDNPLEQRIEELREEIQEILALPEPPCIIPLSAIALFYAQCAWGANSSEASDVDPSTRRWMVSSLFKDCYNFIKASTRGDKELRSWLLNLENSIEEGQEISEFFSLTKPIRSLLSARSTAYCSAILLSRVGQFP
jgi:hypothetical protein